MTVAEAVATGGSRRPAWIWRRVEHGYWRLYHLPFYLRIRRVRRSDDPDTWLKLVRVAPVPTPDSVPEQDDEETYWEEFVPGEWIGSTAS